jgi:hypothetical protein
MKEEALGKLYCKDCSKNLQKCTCMDDTINMKQDKFSEEEIVDFIDWIGANDYRCYSNGWATLFSKSVLTPKQLFEKFKNK